jgi:hypothetical protein
VPIFPPNPQWTTRSSRARSVSSGLTTTWSLWLTFEGLTGLAAAAAVVVHQRGLQAPLLPLCLLPLLLPHSQQWLNSLQLLRQHTPQLAQGCPWELLQPLLA